MAAATRKGQDDVEATDTPTDDPDAAEETTGAEDDDVEEAPTDIWQEEREAWLAANPDATVIPPTLLPPAYRDGTVVSPGFPEGIPEPEPVDETETPEEPEAPVEGEPEPEAPAAGEGEVEEEPPPVEGSPDLPEDLNDATRETLMEWLDYYEIEHTKSLRKDELVTLVEAAIKGK